MYEYFSSNNNSNNNNKHFHDISVITDLYANVEYEMHRIKSRLSFIEIRIHSPINRRICSSNCNLILARFRRSLIFLFVPCFPIFTEAIPGVLHSVIVARLSRLRCICGNVQSIAYVADRVYRGINGLYVVKRDRLSTRKRSRVLLVYDLLTIVRSV